MVLRTQSALTIRTVQASDTKALWEHIKALVKEGAPIQLQEAPTLAEERAFVRNVLVDLRSGKGILLIAEWDGALAGVGSVERAMVKKHATGHIAMLGLGVSARFRRRGVGEALLKEAMRCGREQWGTRIFWLDVYRSNTSARRLYRKLGFRVTGSIPRGAKARGRMTDCLLMVKGS